MISKKKLIYLGVGLVGAYFLFPHANQIVDYVKNKFRKPDAKPEKKEEQPKKVCNCITTPCNC
jgi:hypothetical protein